MGQQKDRCSWRTGARWANERCCSTNTLRRACPHRLRRLAWAWAASSIDPSGTHPRRTTILLLTPGRSSRFSNTHIALLSAVWHAGRENSASITRSMYIGCSLDHGTGRWQSGRLTACLTCAAAPALRTCSAPSTFFDGRPEAPHRVQYASVPTATPTTLFMHSTAFRDADVKAVKKGNIFQRTCSYTRAPFGDKATVSFGFTHVGQPSLEEERHSLPQCQL